MSDTTPYVFRVTVGESFENVAYGMVPDGLVRLSGEAHRRGHVAVLRLRAIDALTAAGFDVRCITPIAADSEAGQ